MGTGEMSESEMLDVVEARITLLEKQILGKRDVPENYTPVSEAISRTSSHLQSAISGREKITAVMKRLSELEKYLNPSNDMLGAADIDAMYQTILLSEPLLRNNVVLLNQIKELEPVLNSEHTKNVPALSKRLEQLALTNLELKDKADDLCGNFRDYIQEYNSVITEISRALVKFDACLTRLEIEAQPKVIDD
ncbi:dynactin subunit 3-like [Schistocerca americana]|uniref:dynactin subunit 3-like n=1 Tax=Schistocerca americana TaxID=7009 RepID=UPI001F4F8AE4|nr:dynactin subunit 3-like [Schistocerca americana]XP_049947302.1 dynactin subunit 3-like [Schistocerca serialis cubense]